MKPFLITPSLLNSWSYIFNCYEGQEEKALYDFINALNKESFEKTESMKRGEILESVIESISKDRPIPEIPEWIDIEALKGFAELVRYGAWQVKDSKRVTINDAEILLYGRVDVLKGPWVYDVKYCEYYEIGKYRDSAQTKIYTTLFPNTYGIKYLVSNGKDTFIETYNRGDIPSIDCEIANFIKWLKTYGYFGTYQNKWESLY